METFSFAGLGGHAGAEPPVWDTKQMFALRLAHPVHRSATIGDKDREDVSRSLQGMPSNKQGYQEGDGGYEEVGGGGDVFVIRVQ